MFIEELITFFDIFGTIVFAITGAVRGVHAKLDLLGVIVLSCTVGVGGGIIRDAVIGATPVMALTNETYLAVCIFTGMIVFKMETSVNRRKNIITICDAVGLGIFTALGASKGFKYDLAPIGIVLSGVITAVGGGVLRDIMVGTVPTVLKSDFYATASMIGGVVYLFLAPTELPFYATFVIVALCVTTIRLLAFHYKFQLPRAGE